MTRTQAINLLDMRRAGADMPAIVVIRALQLTGDLKPKTYAEIPRSLPAAGYYGARLRTQGRKVVQPHAGYAAASGGVR
jgi:hypothetical protein